MGKSEEMRYRLLSGWGRWTTVNWGKSMIITLVLTAILTAGVSKLTLDMTFFSIMPGTSSQVRDLKRIMSTYPAASTITVVIDGRSIEDADKAEERVKAAADAITEEFEKPQYDEWVSTVIGKLDIDYFRNHGVILSKPDDIERFTDLYDDLQLLPLITNLNNDLEREYSGNEDNLADDEEVAVNQFRGLDHILSLMARAAAGEAITDEEIDAATDEYLFGQAYFLSDDSRMALVMVEPTFTMEELDMLVDGVGTIERTSREIASEFGVTAGITGLTTVGRDEMVTSQQGLELSMIIALVLILGLMIFAFRMFSVPLISGIPLVIGIYWTMGLTGFTIRRLNIMTAMYMVALVGLGIDYAIHLLATYIQERDEGVSFLDAVGNAFGKSGSGVITGAITTAAAFFSLQITETEMMRELGLVAGLGIISELAAMFLLVPALLGFREYRREKKGRGESRLFSVVQIRSDLAGGVGKLIVRAPIAIALAVTILSVVLGTGAGRVEIEQNLMNMEAKGLETVELQDTLVEEFSMAPDGLLLITDSLEEASSLTNDLEDLDSVKYVESITPYLPTSAEMRERSPLVEDFKRHLLAGETGGDSSADGSQIDAETLLDELYRLEMNLIELDDMAFLGGMDRIANTLNDVTGRDDEGAKVAETALDRVIVALEDDPAGATGAVESAVGLTGDASPSGLAALQQRMVPILRDKLVRMSSTDPIGLDDLPPIARDSYISPEGDEYLLSIVPTRNPWEEDFRAIYTTQVASVTNRATGLILATNELNRLAEVDGLRAFIAAAVTIFILLLLDFRNFKLAVVTMVPLVFSFLALFGIMGYTGIKIDFVNIITIPLLIGIGVDDAIHISHRYLLEGPGGMERAVAKTGTAILLTSITTIIAFASFIPSIMRAMRSTGVVLSLAVALAFFFSIILHPTLLMIMVERFNLNISPWKGRKE